MKPFLDNELHGINATRSPRIIFEVIRVIKDLVLKNRSYRRFNQDVTVDIQTLRELVNLARLSPSARNLQPLKYILSADREKNDLIFPHLAWAGYLADWDGPVEGERPSAHIIILGDTEPDPGGKPGRDSRPCLQPGCFPGKQLVLRHFGSVYPSVKPGFWLRDR